MSDFETHPVGTANKLKELTELVDKGSLIMTQMKGINDSNVNTIYRQNVTISSLRDIKSQAMDIIKDLLTEVPSDKKCVYKAKMFLQKNL